MNDTTSNKLILLIDDNPLLAGMYQAAFQNSGFDTILASDGESGLTLIKDAKPCGIVLDLLMSGTNGFEVLKRLKDDKSTADIKVIVLTSDSNEEDLNKAKELGAIVCLSKSELTLSEIVEKVKEYLS